MRLFISGGTGYVERVRLGDWPTSWPGAIGDWLGDKNTLLSGGWEFGVGRIDGRPMLLARCLQYDRFERPNPYSIFLDPGRDIWERFGWNGALLAASLLSCPETRVDDLLTSPEQYTDARLADALAGLPKCDIAAVPESSASRNLQILLVGCARIKDVAVVSPSILGFPDRPKLEEMAAVLEVLPPAFRFASGWLVGGNPQHASSLDIRTVLSETAPSSASPTDSLQAIGASILAGLSALATAAADIAHVELLLRTPLWEWAPRHNAAPEELLDAIAGLEVLGEESASQDEVLDAFERAVALAGPIEPMIREARRRRLTTGSAPLDSRGSRTLLRDLFDSGTVLDGALLARLDSDVLVGELAQRGIRPPALADGPSWPFSLRVRVWPRLLAGATATGLPSLLREAVDDLGAAGTTESSAIVADVVQNAVSKSARQGDPLIMWDPVEFPEVESELRECLRLAALDRAKAGSPRWDSEYLRFGADPGGARLASAGIEARQLTALVAFLVDQVRHEGDCAREAREWLVALEGSSLRHLLSLDDKLRVAGHVDAGWAALRAANDLLHGREATEPRAVTARESAFLLEEIRQLSARIDPADLVPDIQGLITLCGRPSGEILDALDPCLHRVSWHTLEGWARQWRAFGSSERLQAAVLRLVESADPIPPALDLDEVAGGLVGEAVYRLLFEDTEKDDATLRTGMGRLLERCREDGRVRTILVRSLWEGLHDDVDLSVFARRYPYDDDLTAGFLRAIDTHLLDRLSRLPGRHPTAQSHTAPEAVSGAAADERASAPADSRPPRNGATDRRDARRLAGGDLEYRDLSSQLPAAPSAEREGCNTPPATGSGEPPASKTGGRLRRLLSRLFRASSAKDATDGETSDSDAR